MPISTGYKYRTPLKSDYLNSIMSSVSRPGLLRRPTLSIVKINNNQGRLHLGAFDAFIVPANAYESSVVQLTTDAYGRNNAGMLVKVTFSQRTDVGVTLNTAAIAIQYSNLKGDSGTIESHDAKIVALSYSDLKNINDYTFPWTASGTQTVTTETKEKTTTVIIATCFSRKTSTDTGYLICNTNGAMLSPLLLNSEGWVGNTYISLQSPFEDNFSSSSVFSNYLRLNSMMTGRAIDSGKGLAAFLNGRNGITQLQKSNTIINLNMFSSDGEIAYFNNLGAFSYDGGNNAYRYHLIALDTTSLNSTTPYSLLRISNSTNNLSSLKAKDIPSSVIAVVELLVSDWTDGTYPTSASGTVTKANFAGFRIFPVVQESSRAVYSENTLYIN